MCLEYVKNEESGDINEEVKVKLSRAFIVSHGKNSGFDLKGNKRLLEDLKQRSNLI